MELSATASSVSEKSVVIQKKEALPAAINKLKSFVVFKEEVAKNYKSRLVLLKETNAAKAQVDATFEDALKVSELLFQAYEKLGELVEQHTAKAKDSGKTGGRSKKGHTGATSLLTIRGLAKEMGVSESWLEQMKLIAKNPQRTEEAFKLARELGPEAGAPPTKTQVISNIRSAERQEGKYPKSRPSELHECTEAILDALSHLREANWHDLPESELIAFNDAVCNFQQRLQEFQQHVTPRETRIAPSLKARQLPLSGLIQRLKLNLKPAFRRAFAGTPNQR